ncbi:MAG: threonine synthase [Alphaproteobacteria bacterium]|nr:threonine synthase [Alphaproteobacteria bacterium]
MRYISTRGSAPALGFDEVLLTGLAADGGLYVPERWPALSAGDLTEMRGLSYGELAAHILAPFVGEAIAGKDLAGLVEGAYAGFDHPEIAPLTEIGENEWLLELFHGPTLAFKDYAMQPLGRLFDNVLEARGKRLTIVGATSGDTGSAAIAALAGRKSIEVFILHPHDRVSEVQRRQMTTVDAANIHNIAIEGTFDDCQDLLKALFADAAFRKETRLSAVNSINWARIAGQIVYYVWAALRLGVQETGIAFAVPTGNFGNVYAGYAARQMGLPIRQLVVGSNRNDILTRFLETGIMEIREVEPSLSPSMDIQVSSNFERLLFDLLDRQGTPIAELMAEFKKSGRFALDSETLKRVRELFDGAKLDDEETKNAIAQIHSESGILLDPHSVVGIMAGRTRRRDKAIPMVAIGTAHPAKFPDAVEAASGVRPALPPHLADLFERTERFEVLANDLGQVRAYIAGRACAA